MFANSRLAVCGPVHADLEFDCCDRLPVSEEVAWDSNLAEAPTAVVAPYARTRGFATQEL